jgi:SPP1 gp7 family putative phage head morphogenesis protein
MPFEALFKKDFKPLPSDDVAALMRRKIPMGSDAFDTLVAEQRAQAFRIAGLNKASLIRKAQQEIARGLKDRASLRDIRRRLLEIFEEEGVQAPGLGHLRTIMRQNMNGVDSIARTRTLKNPAVLAAFPYWQYVTELDSRVRPEHAALHGKVFRADDPFWDHYDPPWEWG